jgi:hypothetical protein
MSGGVAKVVCCGSVGHIGGTFVRFYCREVGASAILLGFGGQACCLFSVGNRIRAWLGS